MAAIVAICTADCKLKVYVSTFAPEDNLTIWWPQKLVHLWVCGHRECSQSQDKRRGTALPGSWACMAVEHFTVGLWKSQPKLSGNSSRHELIWVVFFPLAHRGRSRVEPGRLESRGFFHKFCYGCDAEMGWRNGGFMGIRVWQNRAEKTILGWLILRICNGLPWFWVQDELREVM